MLQDLLQKQLATAIAVQQQEAAAVTSLKVRSRVQLLAFFGDLCDNIRCRTH